MIIYTVKFSELEIGQTFYCNGNWCVKKSSRTALLKGFDKTFYFGQNETVKY